MRPRHEAVENPEPYNTDIRAHVASMRPRHEAVENQFFKLFDRLVIFELQ